MRIFLDDISADYMDLHCHFILLSRCDCFDSYGRLALKCMVWYSSLTSHSTQYRSFRRRGGGLALKCNDVNCVNRRVKTCAAVACCCY